jgi:hypothetical protein
MVSLNNRTVSLRSKEGSRSTASLRSKGGSRNTASRRSSNRSTVSRRSSNRNTVNLLRVMASRRKANRGNPVVTVSLLKASPAATVSLLKASRVVMANRDSPVVTASRPVGSQADTQDSPLRTVSRLRAALVRQARHLVARWAERSALRAHSVREGLAERWAERAASPRFATRS